MTKNKSYIVILLGALVFFLWLMIFHNDVPCPSSDQVEKYMSQTDFIVSGPIECVEVIGNSKGIYKMKYVSAQIHKTAFADNCYWGIQDTTEKVIYFLSYTLNADYVCVKSKNSLIVHDCQDTVGISEFRIFGMSIGRLEKYMKEGCVKF